MDKDSVTSPSMPEEQPWGGKPVQIPRSRPNMLSSGTAAAGNGDEYQAFVNPPRPVQSVNTGLLEDFVLEALAFSSMTERQDEVTEAHRKTFEWIYDFAAGADGNTPASGQDLVPWLRDSEDMGGIYWISGKPGSGKSTLLKLLYDDKRTREELGKWSGAKGVTTAGFFFWTSGSLEQRSQTGLLRSLLHQLLENHRSLISKSFPQVWQRYLIMSTKDRIKSPLVWTLKELIEGLKLFLQHAKDCTMTCLFVDGLDEFGGDHGCIIDLFQSLVAENDHCVKVCLSSRPWPVFEQAFKSVPHLELQDLTLGDRQRYVFDNFEKDAKMRRVLRKEPEGSARLMLEVVRRAEGVFLWVVLVVRSLLKGLQDGDRVQNIFDRLEVLPSDLEAFFHHTLFDSQRSEVKQDASQILQLIHAREVACEFAGDYGSSSLTLWDLTLAQMDPDDSARAMSEPVVQASASRISSLCEGIKTRIESNCAGLLEIHAKSRKHATMATRFAHDTEKDISEHAHSKVSYRHRTIRDWLVYSPSVWDRVVSITLWMNYDPHSSLLASQVLQLKLPFDEPERHRRLDEWWPGIVLALTHARYTYNLGNTPHNRSIRFVDELEKTLTWYWLPKPSQPDDHWARAAFGSYEERNNKTISYPFLALATKFGLREYVVSKVNDAAGSQDLLGYKGGRPLLSYATDFLVSRRQSVFPFSDPEFVQKLLEANQDPNLVYDALGKKEETPWLSCIKLIREALRRKWIASADSERWTKILRLYVEAGADVDAFILADSWDPEISVFGVIELVLDAFDSEGLKEVRDLMLSRSATSRPN